MEPWKMETRTKTCGPIPGGLIVTHIARVPTILNYILYWQIMANRGFPGSLAGPFLLNISERHKAHPA